MRYLRSLSTILLAAALGHAQWIRTNGPGTQVREIVFLGTEIFAGTYGNGVHRFNPSGWTWTTVNNGLTNLQVRSMVARGTDLFAGTNGGIFRSRDSGATWTANNVGLGNYITQYNQCLALHGSTVYAGMTGSGIFRFNDTTSSWVPVNAGLSRLFVYDLASNGNRFYAGTISGVYNSTDGGTNWTRWTSGLGTDTAIYSLAAGGGRVYAGTQFGGAYRSADGGATWTQGLSGLTDPFVNALVVSGNLVFAGTGGGGVCMSADSGATWTAVNDSLPSADRTIYSLAANTSTLFAGTYNGAGAGTVFRRQLSEMVPVAIRIPHRVSGGIWKPVPWLKQVDVRGRRMALPSPFITE